MTVGELILKLSEFDPEQPALMRGALYREMERNASVVDVVIGFDPDNPRAPVICPRKEHVDPPKVKEDKK